MKRIANFLLAYRTTPSTVTGRTPSELFLGRLIRTRLEMLKPEMRTRKGDFELDRKMKNYQIKMSERTKGRQDVRIFQPGQNVRIVNHVQKHKWDFGVIVKKIAPCSHIVNIKGREVKRHIDDMNIDHSLLQSNGPILGDSRSYHTGLLNNKVDDTWMYGEPEDVRSTGFPPRNSTRSIVQNRASTRQRTAVDRYGMIPYR